MAECKSGLACEVKPSPLLSFVPHPTFPAAQELRKTPSQTSSWSNLGLLESFSLSHHSLHSKVLLIVTSWGVDSNPLLQRDLNLPSPIPWLSALNIW